MSLERPGKFGQHYQNRVMSQSSDADGYMKLTLSRNGKKKSVAVHRLVARAFIDNPHNLPEINHIDEDKTNNRVENLEWCTTAYNLTYGHRLDCAKGERSPKSKLTEDQVKTIRNIYIKGDAEFGQAALGRKYGVSQQSIRSIVTCETWRHLLKEEET